ncbi:MAG: hypothetical protein ACK53Y_17805, partial [bacterium]
MASKEGYWCYEHMILQLKDCLDILKTLHPQYDYLYCLIIHGVMTSSSPMDLWGSAYQTRRWVLATLQMYLNCLFNPELC